MGRLYNNTKGLIEDSTKKDLMKDMANDAIAARKLGITYGQYMGYKSSGYLEKFKKIKFDQMAERRADGRKVHFDSTKMEDNF